MSQEPSLRIGIALFDGVEELDWAGPWEVLASWAKHFPADRVEVFTVAESEGDVTCAHGMSVLPEYTWSTAPGIDVLVYPGGEGTRAQLGRQEIRVWVTQVAAQARLVTSVCTGALVLADAGLLNDREATTHWASLEKLSTLGHNIRVRADARYVCDGKIITAA